MRDAFTTNQTQDLGIPITRTAAELRVGRNKNNRLIIQLASPGQRAAQNYHEASEPHIKALRETLLPKLQASQNLWDSFVKQVFASDAQTFVSAAGSKPPRTAITFLCVSGEKSVHDCQ